MEHYVQFPLRHTTLTPIQQRYCTTRKELLAIVMFTRHYKHYLLGREFTLRTDHGSLTWLFRFKHPVGQLGRWLEELSQYSMTIQHRPGVKHINSDALSRIPEEHDTCNCYEAGKEVSSLLCGGCPYSTKLHNQWGAFESEVDYVVPLAARQLGVSSDVNGTMTEDCSSSNYMQQYNSQELRESQMQDTVLRPVITWLEGEPPTQNDLQLQGVGTRKLWNNKDMLHIKDMYYYSWEEEIGPPTLKMVVPLSMREEALKMTHDNRIGGHWGRDKTFIKLRKSFFSGRVCAGTVNCLWTLATVDDPLDGVESLFTTSQPFPGQEMEMPTTQGKIPRTTRRGRPINRPRKYDE